MTEQRIDDLEYSKRIELENRLIKSDENLSEQIRELENDCVDDIEDENSVKQPLDMLILSDSICRHLNVDLINPGGSNKHICRPGAKIDELKDALINFESHYEVGKLVVHVMTNHIPEETPTDIAREMLEFVKDIKLNMPVTKLFVSLVLPKHNPGWLEGINCLNQQIYNASRKMGFDVIQHPNFAGRGCINSDLLARDGIHLSRQGIKQLGVDFKYCIQNH